MTKIDCLLSLPPASSTAHRDWNGAARPAFVGSDPPGKHLGSGGGTAHLLDAAWRQSDKSDFHDWLQSSRKLIVHGSGQSRRLPGYACEGKPLLPLPVRGATAGQTPDQRLLDVQWLAYRALFWHAPERYRVMIACGDVLVRNAQWTPAYPTADVVIVGITSSPEEACRHGVLFCGEDEHPPLAQFLQKPDPSRIRAREGHGLFYLDTGIWLLNEEAVMLLMRRCGWDPSLQAFAGDAAKAYELFDRFALALGSSPTENDVEVNRLKAAVLPLRHARFYHFGTNRSVMASVNQLANPAEHQRAFGHGTEQGNQPVVLNTHLECSLSPELNDVWIENAWIGRNWTLHGTHVLTHIPENDWHIELPKGICLDIAQPRDSGTLCLRPYGFSDAFRGPLRAPDTLWMERPLADWMAARGIDWKQAGLDPEDDIQDAALFPCVSDSRQAGALVAWMIDRSAQADDSLRRTWIEAPRICASALVSEDNAEARETHRRRRLIQELESLSPEEWRARIPRLDLNACLRLAAYHRLHLAESIGTLDNKAPPSLIDVHKAMFHARLAPEHASEDKAFEMLREQVVSRMELDPVKPSRNVLDDQIVWGRSPVRLDLAGGWTDTPPYCLEHGGRVVNLAVDLNGQPPIQVFARCCKEPHIVLRSIDLGIVETIDEIEQLTRSGELGGGFGIARAALRLAGFDPRFHAEGGNCSLAARLQRDFGGGIELNMLAAVPKGSGLGTSSILAATLLGTLSELCGLRWNNLDLFVRTLALEQILTSGGGWQDQVGGIVGGLKWIETAPGIAQKPLIRWLPAGLFRNAEADGRILLYYTGMTRVARNILGEIVRGIFLNDAERLAILEGIRHNADFTADAIQRRSWPSLCEAVRRSWFLNQTIDAGTNPPEIQSILERVAPWTAAAKLLGAGGGGFLLLLAHDETCGRRIRRTLIGSPPNNRSRFIIPTLSETGLQVTRS